MRVRILHDDIIDRPRREKERGAGETGETGDAGETGDEQGEKGGERSQPRISMAKDTHENDAVDVDHLVREGKELVCELCSGFYSLGWVSGTGGSISIKVTRTDTGEDAAKEDGGKARKDARIVMAPSGVMKERMKTADIFVLDGFGEVVSEPDANDRVVPATPGLSNLRNDAKRLRLSECAPLFLSAYHMRNAGAIIHSHAMCTVVATMLHEDNGSQGAPYDEFRCTELEMIKGIKGHGFYDTLTVPIIENTARECELTESLQRAIAAYPNTHAVLVRRHGVYIWGESWEQAKTHAECYHYLFEAAAKMKEMGIDVREPRTSVKKRRASGTRPSTNGNVPEENGHHTAKRPRANGGRSCSTTTSVGGGLEAIILDIEGTTTPLAFVKEVLFPYARAHMESFLEARWETDEIASIVARLREQVRKDVSAGVQMPVLDIETRDKASGLRDCMHCLLSMMDEDRKVPVLKELQGMVWEEGYSSGSLVGQIYDDVPAMLQLWKFLGIDVYIYSSGSIAAQKLLFGNTAWGDLTGFIRGHFDTTTGNKREVSSYLKILEEIGVKDASGAVFVTDIHEEAVAASGAGMSVALSVRPGNYELPQGHGMVTVTSMNPLIKNITITEA